MATTFSSLPFVRRVAVGDCSTPQGADATAQLARSAFEALGGADWTVDDSAPFIPVHEYKRPIPRGDAWKACYGYADSTRSQRSACGAVCYTFTLPADASTGSACDVSSIAGSVVGDRYLDLGVDVHAVLSDSSTPPTVAELLARTADATVCATSSQAPTKPNDRTGVTATLDLSPSSAATRYLHIALLLHDYLGVRGAWIEGGALLDPSTVAVGFSRDVVADGSTGISLFAVSANVDGAPDFTHTQTLGFVVGAVYYRYASNPSTSGADAQRMLALLAAGALFNKFQIFSFKSNETPRLIHSKIERTEGDNERALLFQIGSMAYHNPRLPLSGRSIVVPNVTSSVASLVRVGFVQSSANPGAGAENTDESAHFAVSWNQLITGNGDDLLGFVDVALAANTATDVLVPFSKMPSKDFLYPLAFPIDGARTDVYVRNITTSTTPPWRLNT